MENMSLDWPGVDMEAFKPSAYNVTSSNTVKPSNNELNEKLIDYLDNYTESDSLDWFFDETLNLSIFENFPPLLPVIPVQNEMSLRISMQHGSPEQESIFVYQTPPVETVPIQSTYMPSFSDLELPCDPINDSTVSQNIFDSDEILEKVLTPPNSPKDQDLFKLIQEIGPVDWDSLMLDVEPKSTKMDLSFLPEYSSSVEEFSDSGVSSSASSCTSPNSSCIDDMEFEPVAKLKKFESIGIEEPKPKRQYRKKPEEERKQRKKEQNKTAAIRYRMKKKQEIEDSLEEEKRLWNKNVELKGQVNELSRELKYLKGLMRDMFRKKGLIK